VNWQLVCLATIAVTTVVMAAVQVTLLVRTARLAQQAADAAEEIRREVRPLIAKAHRIADDAGRATSLALAQVERVDRMLTTTAERVDEVVGAVHDAIVVPLKQGSVILSVLRAAMALFGRGQRAGRTSREDEDALFVG
jgi:hypothetical protein